MPPETQEEAIAGVGEAFATGAEGLTPEQQAAFEGVQAAFSEQAIAQDADSISGPEDVTILGTDEVRDDVDADLAELAQQEQQFAAGQQQPPTPPTPEQQALTNAQTAAVNAGLSMAFLQDAGVNINDPMAITEAISSAQTEGMVNGTVFNQALADANREAQQEEDLANQYRNDLNNLASGVFVDDPATQTLIQSINAQFEARIQEMRQINRSRREQTERVGIRLGTARFAPTIAAGIVSEEEQQGVQRIAALEAQRQAAIAQAREAARTRKFKELHLLLGEANAAHDEALKEVAALQKKAIEQSKLISQEARQAQIDSQIAFTALKTTDISEAFLTIQQSVPDMTFKEFKPAWEAMNTEIDFSDFSGNIGQILQAMELGFISPETSLDEALNIFDPSRPFEAQLAELDIAKKSADILLSRTKNLEMQAQLQRIQDGQLSPDQIKLATDLANKIQGNQVFKDMTDVQRGLIGVFEGTRAENGFGDIAAINAFQRMIDPGATVRSEDVALLQEAAGFIDRIDPKFISGKIKTGDKLPEPVRERMRELAKDLYDSTRENYQQTTGSTFEGLAQQSGIPLDLIGAEFQESQAIIGTPRTFTEENAASAPIGVTVIIRGVPYIKVGEDNFERK